MTKAGPAGEAPDPEAADAVPAGEVEVDTVDEAPAADEVTEAACLAADAVEAGNHVRDLSGPEQDSQALHRDRVGAGQSAPRPSPGIISLLWKELL